MKQIPMQPDPHSYWLVQSVTQDGKFLLATSNPSGSEDKAKQQPSIRMIDVASGQSSGIAQMSSLGVKPYGARGDENWIVWAQAPQEPGFFSDWVLYAFNRADHSTKEIARAAKNKTGLPALGSDGSPQIEHGKLVWTEAVPDLINSQRSILKLMDMQTGQVTILSSNGWTPRLSWPYLAWVELQVPPDGARRAWASSHLKIELSPDLFAYP